MIAQVWACDVPVVAGNPTQPDGTHRCPFHAGATT